MTTESAVVTRRVQWRRLYYLLALFGVVTVLGGFYLTDRIRKVFHESVAANQVWVDRLERYSQLGELAGAVNAPGNDIFDDRAVDIQEKRLEKALVTLNHAIAVVRQDAQQSLNGPAAVTVLADLDAIDTATRVMVEEAHRIFDYFRQGQDTLAGQRMATMDRRYAALNAALAQLRAHGMQVQSELLARDRNRADSLWWFEIPLGVAVFCMLGAAMLYGRGISGQVKKDAQERESYIARLRESDERFQVASRATNDVLWDCDIATGTIWRSEGFKSLFGHSDALPTREFSATFIHPDDVERVTRSMDEFLASRGELWTAEYRLRRHDSSYAWVLDRGFVIRGDAGHARRMIGSMMDITDRKESERMKSDFVSFVSHQLRTPLSGMSWMLELAAETPGLSPEAQEYISDARESGHRLVSLVNDLLDIARLESGRTGAVPAVVPLDDLTRSVLHEFQGLVRDKRHDIVLQAGPVAPVWVDPQMVRQVVANLLSNAIKYTPPGGRIDVTIKHQNGTVQWSVKDNGLGVPRLALGRLFEKFYRADNVQLVEMEGTGLGLHLVRLIVQQAGGRVWCESEEGQGALFAFTLPVAQTDGEAT